MDLPDLMGDVSRALDSATQFKQTIDRAKAKQELVNAKVQARKFSHEFMNGLAEVDDYTQYEGLWSDKQQQIADAVRDNLQTYEAKEAFEGWWLQNGETQRQQVVEYAGKREAASIRLDLEDTLQNSKTLPADEAIDAAFSAIENAAAQGVIPIEQAEQYQTAFQQDIWFRDARETVMDTLYKDGYKAARTMLMDKELGVDEPVRNRLLSTLEQEWDHYDQVVRQRVDQTEAKLIGLWATGGLQAEHIMQEENLAVAHPYANQIKEKWLNKLGFGDAARRAGEMDPNEVNNPNIESTIYDMYVDPYVPPDLFKKKVRAYTGEDEKGNPMLSKKRAQYWIERADRKDVVESYSEAMNTINEWYDGLMNDVEDPSEIDAIKQDKLHAKQRIIEIMSSSEGQEAIRNKEEFLQQVASNTIAEKIDLIIDPTYSPKQFKIGRFRDIMHLNDVERFTRMIQNGKLVGVEDRYGGELLRYEQGIHEVASEMFERDFYVRRSNFGHHPIIFTDRTGEFDRQFGNWSIKQHGSKPTYDPTTGQPVEPPREIMIEFQVRQNDLVPMIWHPEIEKWYPIREDMMKWFNPRKTQREIEELYKRIHGSEEWTRNKAMEEHITSIDIMGP